MLGEYIDIHAVRGSCTPASKRGLRPNRKIIVFYDLVVGSYKEDIPRIGQKTTSPAFTRAHASHPWGSFSQSLREKGSQPLEIK